MARFLLIVGVGLFVAGGGGVSAPSLLLRNFERVPPRNLTAGRGSCSSTSCGQHPEERASGR